jgi:hypothetical protein
MPSNELLEFFKRCENKSTLSQIILPFCSDTSGERNPVAFLTGNINLKGNLRKEGKPVSFEEELKEIENLKVKKGQVVDLSAELKNLQIETDGKDEKEIEIKEEWTGEDEFLFKTRKERKVDSKPIRQPFKQESKSLPSEIEEILRFAEMEEEEEEGDEGMDMKFTNPSKVKEIKMELIKQSSKGSNSAVKELSKLKLPKITTTNPLIGDIIERESEIVVKSHKEPDEVSNRIILNDLKKIDLKSSASTQEEEEEISIKSAQLKKPSRFSLRKQ